jgi:pimeloyl-ACP methyl ester carboxylesterase
MLARSQVEALAAAYHLLVPDLPEHGRSADVRPFTITGAMALVADLIRTRAHGGHATVVGLSEGAQIVLQLLATAPDVVDHAIISSALVLPMPGAWMMTPAVVKWSYKLSAEPFANSEWWMRTNMRYAAGVPDAYVDDFRRTFKETTAAGFTNVIVENQRFRLPEGLDRVTAPTLVVCGAGEYAVMRRSTADVAAAIPGAKAFAVTHARKMSVAEQHNWNMTDPDLFTEMVRAWVEGRALPKELVALG